MVLIILISWTQTKSKETAAGFGSATYTAHAGFGVEIVGSPSLKAHTFILLYHCSMSALSSRESGLPAGVAFILLGDLVFVISFKYSRSQFIHVLGFFTLFYLLSSTFGVETFKFLVAKVDERCLTLLAKLIGSLPHLSSLVL